MNTQEVIHWALSQLQLRLAVLTSFQNPVLLHLLLKADPALSVRSIDTGRLPEETFAYVDTLERLLGFRTQWFVPNHTAVEQLVNEKGTYSFRNCVANRLECCNIRKMEPFHRAVDDIDGWFTGIRRDDSPSRRKVKQFEPQQNGKMKINPLVRWTLDDVTAYMRKHGLPEHPLWSKGYTSIGCAPCTRPVTDGEDLRAGRWWWEQNTTKECGLNA